MRARQTGGWGGGVGGGRGWAEDGKKKDEDGERERECETLCNSAWSKKQEKRAEVTGHSDKNPDWRTSLKQNFVHLYLIQYATGCSNAMKHVAGILLSAVIFILLSIAFDFPQSFLWLRKARCESKLYRAARSASAIDQNNHRSNTSVTSALAAPANESRLIRPVWLQTGTSSA